MSEHEQRFDALIGKLKDIRDSIDEIDGTEFGKLEKLFDQLACETDKAITEADQLSIDINWEAEAGYD